MSTTQTRHYVWATDSADPSLPVGRWEFLQITCDRATAEAYRDAYRVQGLRCRLETY